MASYNSGEGSRSGKRARGRNRDGRGKRIFTEQETSDTSNYSLRNTQSRRSGFTECFEDPNPIHETGEYSRHQGPRSTQRGSPRNVNKNTHVVYFWRTESSYSQFHSANFSIKDTRYSCAEQFMMSSKARIFNDPKSLAGILNAKAPAVMKKFGRGVENFDPNIWKMCCRQYVQEGNIAKFSQNPHLWKELLSTEDRYLAEASPADKIWGIGMAENNPQANNPSSWKGTNWLGEALNLVKFEFQTIIFLISNKDKIEEVPEKILFDVFKLGTRDYFEKMKCEIIISEDEEPSHFLGSKRGSKFNQKKKKAPKSVVVEEHLAPNFDVQLPGKVEIGASEKVKHESDGENSLGEKLKSNEGTEFPQNSGQEQTPKRNRKGADEKKSPLSKRKTSPNADEAQSSKDKTKYKKIAFNPEPESPIISASVHTAVQYILTDWARLKLLEDIPLLKQFMGLEADVLEGLKGNCTYQTDIGVINPGITISSVLIDLKREFNQLEHIFANQTSFIEDLNCATNPPVFPTRRPNPKERSSLLSWFPKKSKTTSQKVRSSKKLETSTNEATETLDEPDNIAPEYTQISPPNLQETSTQEETNVTVDKPIEGDDSGTTPMEQGESVGDNETNNPEKLAKNTETSPTEPDESTTENTEVVSKEETKKDVASTTPPDVLSGGNEEGRKSKKKKKSKTDNQDTESEKVLFDKSKAQDTEIVSKKETTEEDVTAISPPADPNMGKEESEIKSKKQKKSTEDNEGTDSAEIRLDKSTAEDDKIVSKMDVTPTSSSDDPNGGMEGGKRKSKKKKKSTDDDQDTDSAKRHKNNSEQTAKLVPYASSSHSDQDSPKDSSENKTSEKSHPKSSPVTKSASETQIGLEATTLDQSEDVKQKPSDTETDN